MSGNFKIALGLIIFLLSSCSLFDTDDPGLNGDSIISLELEVELVTDSLKPSEVLILQFISDDQVEQDTVMASISGIELPFFITDTLTLIGRVPVALPKGQHVIESNYFRNTILLEVLNGVYIQDAEHYLDSLIVSATSVVKNNLDSVTDPIRYNYFIQQMNDLEQDFNVLTGDEKALLSSIIANSSVGLNDLEGALDTYKTETTGGRNVDCGFSCKLLSIGSVALIAATVSTTVASAVVVGVAVGTVARIADKYIKLNLDIQLSRYKDLAIDFLSDGNFWPNDETITELFNFADRKLFNGKNGGRTTGDQLLVVEGEPLEIEFYPTYRAFNNSDAESENPLVAQLISSHLAVGEYWDNNMPDEAGDFYKLEPKHEQRPARNPDGLRVEVISSSDNFDRINIISQEGIPNNYKVIFDSEDDSDQEFTFKIIYEEEGEVAYEEIITADFWSLDYEAWQEKRSGEELKLYNHLLGNGMVDTELSIEAMQYIRQHIGQIEIKENIGLDIIGGLDIFKLLHLIDIRNNPLPSLDLTEAKTNYYFRLYITNCPLSWIELADHSFYSLTLEGTDLTSVNLGKGDLLFLNLYNNLQLSAINGLNTAPLHKAGKGISVMIHSNLISAANFSNPFMQEIRITNEPIGSLDVNQCRQLKKLEIENASNLSSLHLINIDSLQMVGIQETGISDFSISGTPELNYLKLNDSKISFLDLNNFPKLEILAARNNFLSNVIFIGLDNLEVIHLPNNKLLSLNICDMGNVKHLNINENEFSESAIQQLIECFGEDVVDYSCSSYADDKCPQ